jgi:hypothetical protein
MTEEQLNENYIREKLQGICQDCMWLEKTLPIIREMLSDAYLSGLNQYKFDLRMELLCDKIAIPEELAEDEEIKDLLDMPSYKNLHDRIKMALEYVEDYNIVCNMNKLKSILKGEIRYEKKRQQ